MLACLIVSCLSFFLIYVKRLEGYSTTDTTDSVDDMFAKSKEKITRQKRS